MSTEKISQVSITKADVRKAVRQAPNEIRPNTIGATNLGSVQGLGPCCTLLIIGTGYNPSQLVVHRPVGITDLDKDEWVMSECTDIDRLLARAKDPRQGEIERVRAGNRRTYLLKCNLLETGSDGKSLYYPGLRDVSRQELLSLADAAFKKAKKEGKTSGGAVREDYLLEVAKPHEKAIGDALRTPEAQAEIAVGAEQTYRTRGGISADLDQQGVPGLKGKSLLELMALLPKLIFEGVGRGERINVQQTTVIQAPKEPGGPSGADIARIKEDQEAEFQDSLATIAGAAAFLQGVSETAFAKPKFGKDDAQGIKDALKNLSDVIEARMHGPDDVDDSL